MNWVSRCLLKQRMMEVVVTTGLLELYVVQSSSQIITTNKPTPNQLFIHRYYSRIGRIPHRSSTEPLEIANTRFFTGRMPSLSPNQQWRIKKTSAVWLRKMNSVAVKKLDKLCWCLHVSSFSCNNNDVHIIEIITYTSHTYARMPFILAILQVCHVSKLPFSV